MFTLVEENKCHAVIKVFGLGGGGGNAINTMIEEGLTGVEFISANTDAQALEKNLAPLKIQMGARITSYNVCYTKLLRWMTRGGFTASRRRRSVSPTGRRSIP